MATQRRREDRPLCSLRHQPRHSGPGCYATIERRSVEPDIGSGFDSPQMRGNGIITLAILAATNGGRSKPCLEFRKDLPCAGRFVLLLLLRSNDVELVLGVWLLRAGA